MRYQELIEGRDAPLYHFTRLDSLFKIIHEDRLGTNEGISLTRDANTPYFSHGFWDKAVLVINQTRLATMYAFDIKGGDIYNSDTEFMIKTDQERHRAKEAEERLSKAISPLHSYLRAVILGDTDILTKLMRYMRTAIAGKPMPKVWVNFEEKVKRQGSYPDWNSAVRDPENWRKLFAYCETNNIPLLRRNLRLTFGSNRNLWQREFH